jgi:hypothetical protein
MEVLGYNRTVTPQTGGKRGLDRILKCQLGQKLQSWDQVVRLARFERATFGSGDRRSSPAELQAHALKIQDLASESNL